MMNRFAAIVAQGPRADAHAGGKTSKRGVRAVIRTQEMKVHVLGKVFCPKGEWTKFWITFPQESRAQNFGHRPFRVKPSPKQTLIAERATAHHNHPHCGRFARRVKSFEPSRCPRHGTKTRQRPQDNRPGPKVRTQTGTHTPGHGSRAITGPRSQVTAMERKYPLDCSRQSRGYEGALDVRS